jgi:hypothetical protein
MNIGILSAKIINRTCNQNDIKNFKNYWIDHHLNFCLNEDIHDEDDICDHKCVKQNINIKIKLLENNIPKKILVHIYSCNNNFDNKFTVIENGSIIDYII